MVTGIHKRPVDTILENLHTDYKETFDEFIRSLIHTNKTSKVFTQKEVQLLWDLLERWESNKRGHNVRG